MIVSLRVLTVWTLMAALGPAVARAETPEAGQTRDITFDTLKFDLKKDEPFKRSMLTEKIEALAGKSVRIRGWIHPASAFKQTGLTKFIFVRDDRECCFGPGAALFDCLIVEMKGGATADFSTKPIAVEGEFSIKEYKALDGKIRAIYHVGATSAR